MVLSCGAIIFTFCRKKQQNVFISVYAPACLYNIIRSTLFSPESIFPVNTSTLPLVPRIRFSSNSFAILNIYKKKKKCINFFVFDCSSIKTTWRRQSPGTMYNIVRLPTALLLPSAEIFSFCQYVYFKTKK